MASTLQFDQWQSAAGANYGTVLQVVNVYDNTTLTGSTAFSFTRLTGLTATITPKFATSKILIFGTMNAMNAGNRSMGVIRRSIGGAEVTAGSYTTSGGYQWNIPDFYTGGTGDFLKCQTFNLFDSPGTISTIEYRTYITSDSTVTWYYNRTAPTDTWGHRTSSMTVMEIAQ
jgi:hypothetical protein